MKHIKYLSKGNTRGQEENMESYWEIDDNGYVTRCIEKLKNGRNYPDKEGYPLIWKKIIILLFLLNFTGCDSGYQASIVNKSEETVVLGEQLFWKKEIEIPPNVRKNVKWNISCQLVYISGEKFILDTSDAPYKSITINRYSNHYNVVFENSTFFYIYGVKKLSTIPKLKKCVNT